MNRPWDERQRHERDERLSMVIELTGSLDAALPCLTIDQRLNRALHRLRLARAKALAHDAYCIARHEARSARLRADELRADDSPED